MAYSDQKYYSHDVHAGKITVVSGTATASSATNAAVTTVKLPLTLKPTQYVGGEVIVTTAATASTGLSIALASGTTVFLTFPTLLSAAGSIVVGTLTNTAVVTTATVTNTLANGSTVVGSITSTTDYSKFGTNTAPTVYINGTATASGDTSAVVELYIDTRELWS